MKEITLLDFTSRMKKQPLSSLLKEAYERGKKDCGEKVVLIDNPYSDVGICGRANSEWNKGWSEMKGIP